MDDNNTYSFVNDIQIVCNYILQSHDEKCTCEACLAAMRLANEIALVEMLNSSTAQH